MSNSGRELTIAFAKLSHDYQREAVIDAAANVLRHALIQEHDTRDAAEERLDHIVYLIKTEFRTQHYGDDGKRGRQRIIVPSLRQLLNMG